MYVRRLVSKLFKKQTPLVRGEADQLVCRWQDHRDVDARDRVVAAYMPLIVKTVRKYPGAAARLDEVYTAGVEGLLIAINRFDRDRGASFGTYAAFWVRAYVITEIRNGRLFQDRTRVGRLVYMRAGRALRDLAKEGRPATYDAIAEKLGRNVEAVTHAMLSLERPLSLHTPVRGDSDLDGETHLDSVVSSAPGPDELCESLEEQHEIQTTVRAAVAQLGARERRIVEARLLSDPPLSLEELSAEFNLSRERIRQLEKRARAVLAGILRPGSVHSKVEKTPRFSRLRGYARRAYLRDPSFYAEMERLREVRDLAPARPGIDSFQINPEFVYAAVGAAERWRTIRGVARALKVDTATLRRWMDVVEARRQEEANAARLQDRDRHVRTGGDVSDSDAHVPREGSSAS